MDRLHIVIFSLVSYLYGMTCQDTAPDFDEERDALESKSREPQTLVMILVKALQKAPSRASVSVWSLHQSSSLIDQEGR